MSNFQSFALGISSLNERNSFSASPNSFLYLQVETWFLFLPVECKSARVEVLSFIQQSMCQAASFKDKEIARGIKQRILGLRNSQPGREASYINKQCSVIVEVCRKDMGNAQRERPAAPGCWRWHYKRGHMLAQQKSGCLNMLLVLVKLRS